MLEILGVTRTDHGLRAQDGAIPLGAYTAFVGPNDSGKTGWLRSVVSAVNGTPMNDELGSVSSPTFGVYVALDGPRAIDQLVDLYGFSLTPPADLEFAPVEDSHEWGFWRAVGGLTDAATLPASAGPFDSASAWLDWLAHAGRAPETRELLAVALERPTVLRLHAPADIDRWRESCWLCVTPTDPRVLALLDALELSPVDPHGVLAGEEPRSTEPSLPVPVFPLPGTFDLDALRAAEAPNDPGAIRRRFVEEVQNGADLPGLVDELNAALPPLLRERYALIAVEKRFAEPDLLARDTMARHGRTFELEELAAGWRLWIGIAVELAISRRSRVERGGDRPDRTDVLVVDEPEQHLHADAVRSLSRWLAEQASPQLRIAVATHASLFAEPRGAEVVIVQLLPDPEPDDRGDRRSSRVTVRQRGLAALDELASVMGWRVGELVTLFHTVLYVEGRVDEMVLEALFGRELRAAGVLVTPIHGLRNVRGIPHSRVLTQLLPGLRLAILVDALTAEQIATLHELADEELVHAARSRSTETGAVAQLLLEVPRERRREVRALSHGAEDIIGLFDDELLRAELPRYPGRSASEAALERRRRSATKTWKQHMRESYGLPASSAEEEQLVRRLLAAAASRDRRPPELVEVIAAIAGPL